MFSKVIPCAVSEKKNTEIYIKNLGEISRSPEGSPGRFFGLWEFFKESPGKKMKVSLEEFLRDTLYEFLEEPMEDFSEKSLDNFFGNFEETHR